MSKLQSQLYVDRPLPKQESKRSVVDRPKKLKQKDLPRSRLESTN